MSVYGDYCPYCGEEIIDGKNDCVPLQTQPL